jgi:divalent metal cation (Fe/Co/Zn/Cd) transporter
MSWVTLFLAAIAAGLFLLKRGRLDRVSNLVYMFVGLAWLVAGFWLTFGLLAAISLGSFHTVSGWALLLAIGAVVAWWALGLALIRKRRQERQQALAARGRG